MNAEVYDASGDRDVGGNKSKFDERERVLINWEHLYTTYLVAF